ncbi:MAG: hypothetical protein QE284_12405 [Rhizobium sp.]|nr:hypothetical protein [Rhizobium sp.]
MTLKSMIQMTVALTAAVFPLSAKAQSTGEAAAAAVKQKIDAMFPLKGDLATLFTAKSAGDGVDLIFDTERLLDLFKGMGLTTEGAVPLATHLTPQPDGTFKLAQQANIAIKAKITTAAGQMNVDVRAGSIKGSGVSDPDLRYMKSMETEITGLDLAFSTPSSASHRTVDRWIMSQSTSNVADGKFDLVSKAVEVGRRETGSLNDMSMDRNESTTTIKAMPYRALQDLLTAWLVQAQDGKAPATIADSLRQDIRQLMPFGTEISMQGRLDQTRIAQGATKFGLEKIDYDVMWKDLTGLSSINFKMNIEGVDTGGQLPPSYAKLVPDTIALDMTVTGIDVQTPWRYYFETVDFANPAALNENQTGLITSYLLPDDKIPVSVNKMTLTGDLYQAQLSGTATYRTKGSAATAEMRLTTPSLDPLIAHLQDRAKSDPQLGQAAFFALMAKGFAAKGTDGSMYWDLAMTENGQFLVNGHDFTPPRQPSAP